MRMKTAAFMLLGLVLGSSAGADAQTVGASLTIGTNGPGLSLSTPISNKLNLRLGGNYFTMNREFEQTLSGDNGADTRIALNTDGTMQLVGGVLDYHPGGGAFRFSVGAYYNGLKGDGNMRLLDNYQVKSKSYTPEEVGTMDVTIDFASKIAPYAGLGFGNALTSRVGFTMDVGALYIGNPDVAMAGTGMIKPTEQNAPQIEENLNWVKVFPVFSIGLTARLF
jgi:hypothetical protein